MSNEQELLHKLMRLLDQQYKRHHDLADQPNASDIQPGSELSGDAAVTHPYQVGHGAWHALTVALDHLVCLRSSLRGEDGHIVLHTHAQFTLVRAALENAARAVWLLRSSDRQTRVTRRLAMQRNEVRAQYKMRDLVGKPGRRTKQQSLDELNTLLAAALGVTDTEAGTILKNTPADYKNMVRDGAVAARYPADVAEIIWSGGSALAHGDTFGTLSILEKQIEPSTAWNGHGISTTRVTASVDNLYWTTVAAAVMLDTGYDLYAHRAKGLYTG